MKFAYIFDPILMAAIPAAASAQDVLQPKYAPGFDCATVPAGSQRQACQDSQLQPTVDPDMNQKQSPTAGALQTPGTVSPPTVPNEPGGEIGNGPGTGGANTRAGQ